MNKVVDAVAQGWIKALKEAASLGFISECAADHIFERSASLAIEAAKKSGVGDELYDYAKGVVSGRGDGAKHPEVEDFEAEVIAYGGA